MINENEINVSNRSYTKKDFYQVYNELLDLADKLSPIYQPSSDNESSPFIVLLKLLSTITDKLNYNIDTSVNQVFMPSVSQMSAMRDLCERFGYEMKYYNSNTGKLTLTYYGNDLPNADEVSSKSIRLKVLQTTFTNNDNTLNYVMIGNNKEITNRYTPIQVDVIEGTKVDATSNSSKNITINSIINNKFYFNETQIASNGVFVKDGTSENWTEWESVNNLSTVDKDKVFKFGYDSALKLPYIEFKSNIEQTIGDYINITYIRTLGTKGNAGKDTITVLSSASTLDIYDSGDNVVATVDLNKDSTSLVITNEMAFNNSSDVETIDEAYNGYKNSARLYNTLISCRDYAKFIYSLTLGNNSSTPLISNCQVCDIRDDVNKTTRIMTFDAGGMKYKLVADKDDQDNELINHFDLMIYPLGYMQGNKYAQSFTRCSDDVLNELIYDINNNDYKSLSHQIKTGSSDDLLLINNKQKIRARITTYNKLNTFDEVTLVSKVNTALFKNFNPRMLNYGDEIPYDTIVKVIEEADDRIKYVSVDEPETTTFIVECGSNLDDNKPYELDGSSDIYLKLIAKNILAGRLRLLDVNEDFKYTFNMATSSSASDGIYGSKTGGSNAIKFLKTTFKRGVSAIKTTLSDNEVYQFYAPNLMTEFTYPGYTNYYLELDINSPYYEQNYIPANVDYSLHSGDVLYINYTQDGVVTDIKYEYNKITTRINGKDKIEDVDSGLIIIKPNFDIYRETASGKEFTKDKNLQWDLQGMYMLDATQQIEKRKPIKVDLKNKYFCWWNISSFDSKFTQVGTEYEYILGENEYFIYTDINRTSLIIYGSGTKLIINSAIKGWLHNANINTDIDIKALFEGNVNEVVKYMLPYAFSNENTLTIMDLQFITLTQGDKLTEIAFTNIGIDTISSDNVYDVTSASYQIQNEDEASLDDISNINLTNFGWKFRIRLDFNMNKDIAQEFKKNEKELSLYNGEPSSATLITTLPTSTTDAIYINSSREVIGKGTLYDARTYTLSSSEISDLLLHAYKIDTNVSLGNNVFQEHWLNVDLASSKKLSCAIHSNTTFGIFMLYVEESVANAIKLSDANTTAKSTLRFYNDWVTNEGISELTSYGTSLNLRQGINIIQVKEDTKLTLTNTNNTNKYTVLLGDFMIINNATDNGVNKELFGLTTAQAQNLCKKISKLGKINNVDAFYYNYMYNNELLIDTTNTLTDAKMWYSSNNVAKKMVLSSIDENNSDIQLTKASRL